MLSRRRTWASNDWPCESEVETGGAGNTTRSPKRNDEGTTAMPDSISLQGDSVLCNARSILDVARRAHMLALQDAILAGTPDDELAHDVDAFHCGAHGLIAVMRGVEAPMVLAALG